jgi:hypothetical protein
MPVPAWWGQAGGANGTELTHMAGPPIHLIGLGLSTDYRPR